MGKPKPVPTWVPGYISQIEEVPGGVMAHVTLSATDFNLIKQPSVYDYLSINVPQRERA